VSSHVCVCAPACACPLFPGQLHSSSGLWREVRCPPWLWTCPLQFLFLPSFPIPFCAPSSLQESILGSPPPQIGAGSSHLFSELLLHNRPLWVGCAGRSQAWWETRGTSGRLRGRGGCSVVHSFHRACMGLTRIPWNHGPHYPCWTLRIYICPRTPEHICICLTHVHTHAHTCIHVHPYTCTHTHTHTHICLRTSA
jgi:hypothetical protein